MSYADLLDRKGVDGPGDHQGDREDELKGGPHLDERKVGAKKSEVLELLSPNEGREELNKNLQLRP